MVTPLRIMHILDFYPAYIDQFYRNHPGLTLKSSAEQNTALLKDAFGAIHMIGAYLPQDSCVTEYFISTAKPLQRAWAKEHGQIFPGKNPYWELEMICRRIAHFRPDVLYVGDPIQHDGRFLQILPFHPRLIMGWKAADIAFNVNLNGYDIILSGLPKLLEFAELRGAKHGVLFSPGMPKWLAEEVAHTPKTMDVCFVGSVFPAQHTHRIAMLDALAQNAKRHNFSLALYLNCDPHIITPAMRPFVHPPIFGFSMMKAFAASRIVVDDRATHGVLMPNGRKSIDLGGGDTINMRMFEATGSGALLLTEELPGVSRYFEPRKEVACWKNTNDLIEKVLYYLNHDQECVAMTNLGRVRCLTEHSMENAVKHFMEIIYKYLPD